MLNRQWRPASVRGPAMITACGVAAVCLLLPTTAVAQGRDTLARDTVLDARKLPREIAREVVDLFNGPGTLRSNGSLTIAPGREVRGDVAVLNGPLIIGGKVTGRVIAINTDVELQPGARLESDLLIVGGAVKGANDAFVGGEICVYREPLNYRRNGERIVAARGDQDENDWWWQHHGRRSYRNHSDLEFTSAHTYNRVEGFPIYFGPRLRHDFFDIFELNPRGQFGKRIVAYDKIVRVRSITSIERLRIVCRVENMGLQIL